MYLAAMELCVAGPAVWLPQARWPASEDGSPGVSEEVQELFSTNSLPRMTKAYIDKMHAASAGARQFSWVCIEQEQEPRHSRHIGV